MVRRIDTYNRKVRELSRTRKSLSSFLHRARTTMNRVLLAVDQYEEIGRLEEWIKWFEQVKKSIVEGYDSQITDFDSWAKDDWPHAVPARVSAVGTQFFFSSIRNV